VDPGLIPQLDRDRKIREQRGRLLDSAILFLVRGIHVVEVHDVTVLDALSVWESMELVPDVPAMQPAPTYQSGSSNSGAFDRVSFTRALAWRSSMRSRRSSDSRPDPRSTMEPYG
jgi:hypothetical protein